MSLSGGGTVRTFEIYDAHCHPRTPIGMLYVEDGECHIRLDANATESTVPLLFMPFVRRGEQEIPPEWTLRWIEERVVPSGRQNLGAILKENGLKEYDPIALFIEGEGVSSQDDFKIREVSLSHTDYAHVKLSPKEHAGQTDYASVKLPSSKHASQLGLQVGAAFRKARLAAGITQQELSWRTGIQQAAISRFERGEGNPTLGTIDELAQGIGASAAILFE